MLTAFFQDLHYSLRQMRKSPGFAVIAILTLALGVGVATAIFSVVDAVLLRPLPFNHPELIYQPQTMAGQGYVQPPSYLSFKDMREQNHTFSAFAGYWEYTSVNLEAPSGPIALNSVQGSDNFFEVFGVQPILGRTFRPGEDQPGRSDLAVLSYEVWQSNFGGQKSVLDSTIRLDGKPYICIGVMPAGFRYPLGIENAIYTPLHVRPQWLTARGTHWIRTIGRLKPGVTQQQAEADMTRVMADIGRTYPDTDGGRKLQLIGLSQNVNRSSLGPLAALSAAVLAILLIGCINVAGLLLARGVKREREIAMRVAVGASRSRVVRLMLTESLVLAFFGAIGGVAISSLLLQGMRIFLVQAMQRGADVHINPTVLAAALLISVATSVAASLAPAFRLSGVDPNRALKSGGNAGTGRGQHRLRSAFIVTQVALSLMLLFISGVLLRTLSASRNTDLGFDPGRVLTAEIDLSAARYEGRDVIATFYRPLLERVRQIPGVKAAGTISNLPIQSSGVNQDVHISGQPPYPPNQQMLAETRFVSEGYFDAMGIHLSRGRMLTPSLDPSTSKAGTVVVNEAFVKQFIPHGLDPVGQHIDDSDKPDEKTGIVGVVTSIRQDRMKPALAEMDWIVDEIPAKDRSPLLNSTSLVVRTSGDPKAIIPSLRNAFREVDPTLPFRTPETMDEIVSDQLVLERMESWLFGIFAGLALLLAVVGIYGLISHEVELGTREIGVRMALGATRGGVLAMIFRRVSIMLAGGLAAGLVLTFASRKAIASVVMVDFANQAGLLMLLALALAFAGMIAALLPARRAARIEPMEALRAE